MNYSSPTIEDALEADGFTHVMVAPSAFPTAAIHTMWDVANAAVDRAVLPWEGVVHNTRSSGMTVYYTSQGLADIEPGRTAFREGLTFLGVTGAMEAEEEEGTEDLIPYQPCDPGYICVTVSADELTGGELKYMLYETTEADWPQAFVELPVPDWVVADPGPVPDRFPARVRIPIDQNLIPVGGQAIEGARLGLAVVTGVASVFIVEPDDSRGFSDTTLVFQSGAAMNYGAIELDVPQGDVCDLNPYDPSCLTGPLLWQEHYIGEEGFVPGAIYMDVADLDGDGNLDLVANQIFSGTVTVYRHPGDNLADPWLQEIIVDDLVSPSDMWLADMDNDGLMDVVSADHTAHRGVWHKNPGTLGETWEMNLIFRNIRLPGDFVMVDMDEDGDLDWVGTSLTLGQAFIVEQVQPETSLVTTISLPDSFSGTPTKLLVTLAETLPVTGPPTAVLATINNADADGDGTGDVEEILNPNRDLVLALPDVGVVGDYFAVAALFMEGGGQLQPVPGVDYMAESGLLSLGSGQAAVGLELILVPAGGPVAGTNSGFASPSLER